MAGPERAAAATASRRRGGPLARLVYRLLARCHDWAESGWGGAAVGGWGFLQGSVVPGPSDAVLIPLGISDPSRVFRLAGWATLGATAGGLVAYLIGLVAFEQLGLPLLELVGVGPARLAASRDTFARHGWQLVLLSAISPLSTKAICVAAGAFGVPAWQFAPALAAGRALRFFGIALLVRMAGPRVLDWLSRRVGVPPVTSTTASGIGRSDTAAAGSAGERPLP
ncbi:MAG: YqaA family protein [Gemmatimonadaceae bacterium]